MRKGTGARNTDADRAMAHDEDGYKSKLELTMGVEDEDSPFRAVLKLTIDDEEEGLMYAESFPAFRCPICGEEL